MRGKLIVVDNLTQVAPEGFDIGEEDAACAGLDDTSFECSTVEPVEDSIGIVVVLRGVHAVQAEELNEGNALFGAGGEVAYAHTAFTALVEDVEAEVFSPYLGAAQEVDVFHHQPPKRAAGVRARPFEQLDDKGVRVVDAVGGEFTHLVDGGVANDLVLEGDGQHLVRTEGLVEGDESELGVVGVLVAVQQTGTFHFLIVGTGCESCGLHMGGDVVDAAYGRGVEDFEQVVAAVGGTLGASANQAAVGGEVFAQVGEGKDVAVVGHGGSHIGAPHFHADNLDVGVGRGKG